MEHRPIDEYNVTQFSNGSNYFICTMCASMIRKDDCISYKGYNLICNRCATKMRNALEAGTLIGTIIDMIHERGRELKAESEGKINDKDNM